MSFRLRQLFKKMYYASNFRQNQFQTFGYIPVTYIGCLVIHKQYGTLLAKDNLSSTQKTIKGNIVEYSSELDESDLKNKLQQITSYLEELAPNFFKSPMKYDIYDKDLIFENQVTNKTTVGLWKYKLRIDLIKMWANMNFSYLHVDILQISSNPDDLSVTIRWRIRGISGIRVFLQFWKFKLTKWNEKSQHEEIWYDGISHLYLNQNGLIYKHVITKITPESNAEIAYNSSNILKGILAISLVPNEYLQDYA